MAAPRLHGTIWRWHFFAGLAACPLLLVVALTGAAYSFQPELERWIDADLITVEPTGERRSLDSLAALIPPTCTPTGFGIPGESDRALRVYCSQESRREVYIDPYRGVVLGEREWDHSLFGVVFGLHWELLLGEPGRIAIEWATSCAVLLFVSGVCLWWPRGKRRFGGVLWPRRLAGRHLLRDLHAVFGAYVVPVLFLLSATGLFWTALAGQKRWHPLTEDAVHTAWDHPPTSAITPGAQRIGIDAAVHGAGLDLRREWREVYLAPPATADASYAFFLYDAGYEVPSAGESIWVDAYTGARLLRLTWDDRSAAGKIDSAAYPIHIGAFLSLPGRILAFVAALILAALCATGPWMWWKRRPRGGGLGAPPAGRRLPWPLLAVVAVLGWLLPTIGWTLVAILGIEALVWLWRRRGSRIPPAAPG